MKKIAGNGAQDALMPVRINVLTDQNHSATELYQIFRLGTIAMGPILHGKGGSLDVGAAQQRTRSELLATAQGTEFAFLHEPGKRVLPARDQAVYGRPILQR